MAFIDKMTLSHLISFFFTIGKTLDIVNYFHEFYLTKNKAN